MDDIRVKISFKGHRKRKKLIRLLGQGATDYLLDLWISTAQNHPDGKLTNMDELDISLESGWEGEPDKFVNSLVECRFLDKNSDGYKLHDWKEHQPWVYHAPERSERARQAALVRWGGNQDANGMQGACDQHKECNAPSPSPSPSPKPSPKKKKDNVYPEWLDLFLWKQYKIYRTKIKAPLTDHAEQLSLTALREQIDAGFKQSDIINQTIESGKWKSFFPVKNKFQEPKQKTPKIGKAGDMDIYAN